MNLPIIKNTIDRDWRTELENIFRVARLRNEEIDEIVMEKFITTLLSADIKKGEGWRRGYLTSIQEITKVIEAMDTTSHAVSEDEPAPFIRIYTNL